jgi:hypothetical protein
MNNQQASSQPSTGAGPAPAPETTTYSPEVLQRLVDQAAYFNVFSLSDKNTRDIAIKGQNGARQIIGFNIHEELHRFTVIVQPPNADSPLQAANIVGESYGTFRHRWLLAPDDFVSSPDREPPPTALDPSRSQRFIMLDGLCTFGSGDKDGFRGFGAGVTFPITNNGRTQLLAATVGTILEGFGAFKNHDQGTYLHCGSLSPEEGFTGNMLLRVMDSQGTLRSTGSLHTLKAQTFPEADITYVLFRGQAVPDDPVRQRFGPDGQFIGLTVVQGLRLISLNSDASGNTGPRSVTRMGQTVGKITAHVNFNPFDPGGTNLNPIPFTTFDELNFFDEQGRDLGGFTADSSEGRVFNVQVAGQKGIRFGGVGQILRGTGPFQAINGLMTDNSVVIFQPHVSASLYVLRIHDPDGRFRSGINGVG